MRWRPPGRWSPSGSSRRPGITGRQPAGGLIALGADIHTSGRVQLPEARFALSRPEQISRVPFVGPDVRFGVTRATIEIVRRCAEGCAGVNRRTVLKKV